MGKKTGLDLPLGTVLDHPCPECGAKMKLRNSRYGKFYGCDRFPKCKGAHGAHPNGEPLGVPATKATKQARMDAHEVFDRLWKDGYMSRGRAYAWLVKTMDLEDDELGHIGRFDDDQCATLIEAVEIFLSQPKKDRYLGSQYRGAPLRRIVSVSLDDDYPRTGWYTATLECGHQVKRLGYVRKDAEGNPVSVKTRRCHCIECLRGEEAPGEVPCDEGSDEETNGRPSVGQYDPDAPDSPEFWEGS